MAGITIYIGIIVVNSNYIPLQLMFLIILLNRGLSGTEDLTVDNSIIRFQIFHYFAETTPNNIKIRLHLLDIFQIIVG